MAVILEIIPAAQNFLSELLNVPKYEIDIIKAAKADNGWEVEASSDRDIFKHHVVLDDKLIVRFYEKNKLEV